MSAVTKLVLLFVAFSSNLTAHAYEKRPYLIAVAGGSASGKTHNARMIVEALGADRAILMSADNYFAPEKQACQFFLEDKINYDHPSAVDLKKLASHLAYLRAGFPVQVKEYTFGRAVEHDTWITYEPKEFIVVEGIFALDPLIAEQADFRVFVDVDHETRFQRRLSRDQKERGLSEPEVRDYFTRVVEPMHQRYIQPTALRADQIIESPSDRDKVLKIVRIVKDQAHKMRAVKATIMQDTYNQAIAKVQADYPGQYELADIDKLFASQSEMGFFRLSQKSAAIDGIVRHAALNPDAPSQLVKYLEENPVPTITDRSDQIITDHHHLLLALRKKGIRQVLTKRADPTSVDPTRLNWIRAQNRRLPITELVNNPYRSLVSLTQELGYVNKTGKFHEEFEWAEYLKLRFETEDQYIVNEEKLLDPDVQTKIVERAIAFAKDSRAQYLPGYVRNP